MASAARNKGGTKLAKSTTTGTKANSGSARKKIGSTKPAITAADIIAEKRGQRFRPVFYILSFH